MNIFIPIISAILFWLGGRDQMDVPFNQKLFRRIFLPLFLGFVGWILTHSFVLGLYSGLAYAFSLNVFGYGENHPIRKWFGKDVQWILYGFFFGASSFFVLHWLSFLQCVISASCSWGLLKWSNDGLGVTKHLPENHILLGNKLNQEYVEIGIAIGATILYVFVR